MHLRPTSKENGGGESDDDNAAAAAASSSPSPAREGGGECMPRCRGASFQLKPELEPGVFMDMERFQALNLGGTFNHPTACTALPRVVMSSRGATATAFLREKMAFLPEASDASLGLLAFSARTGNAPRVRWRAGPRCGEGCRTAMGTEKSVDVACCICARLPLTRCCRSQCVFRTALHHVFYVPPTGSSRGSETLNPGTTLHQKIKP